MLSSKPGQQQQDQTTTPGTYYVPYSLQRVCGFFNIPCYNHITLKMQEKGPTIFRPYPRRLVCINLVPSVSHLTAPWSELQVSVR